MKTVEGFGKTLMYTIIGRAAILGVLFYGAAPAANAIASCETTWSSKLASPDGKWIAIAHEDVCQDGIVSDHGVKVDLTRSSRPQAFTTILLPWGQWNDPKSVRLRWESSETLTITVPNRTNFDLRMTKLGSVEINIMYDGDNRNDREAWINWIKSHKKWLESGGNGIEPKLRPVPN